MADGGGARRGRPRVFDEDEVLDRAMHLFWEKGYDGTSMVDLVRAMGINSPSIYGAFGSKERLYLRAMARYTKIGEGITGRALAEQPTARQAIEVMLKQHVELFTGFASPRGCLVVLGAANTSQAGPEVREALRRQRGRIREAIRNRLAQAVEDGELPADSDVDALATEYHTFLNGLSLQTSDGVPAQVLLNAIDNVMTGWGRTPPR
jgi:AcrR family transcriptional regulator